MTKPWVKKVVCVVLVLFLIPVPAAPVTDGGTVEYYAVLYNVTSMHSLYGLGYLQGTIIRILGFEVYNSVEYYPFS